MIDADTGMFGFVCVGKAFENTLDSSLMNLDVLAMISNIRMMNSVRRSRCSMMHGCKVATVLDGMKTASKEYEKKREHLPCDAKPLK